MIVAGPSFLSNAQEEAWNSTAMEQQWINNGNGKMMEEVLYPPALASHHSILSDQSLFFETLDVFLAALGTKLIVPRIGRQDLNLHRFYMEVTGRGGLAQVIRCMKWKEIAAALEILKDSLSASFVLRKHYLNLLYHYEQVHCFGVQGRLAPPPAPLPAPVPLPNEVTSPYETHQGSEPPMTGKRKRKTKDSLQTFGADPTRMLGNIITGAIEGKCEDGYVVTVVIGEEKISGVMYHVEDDATQGQFAIVPGLLGEAENVSLVAKREYKKRCVVPKIRSRTGYNIFFKEQRARLKQLHPEISHGKTVIEMWNKLSEEEKAFYNIKANEETRKAMEDGKLSSPIGSDGYEELDFGGDDGNNDYCVSLDGEEETQVYRANISVSEASQYDDSLLLQEYPDSEKAYPTNDEDSTYPMPINHGYGSTYHSPLSQTPQDPPQEYPGSEKAYPTDDRDSTYSMPTNHTYGSSYPSLLSQAPLELPQDRSYFYPTPTQNSSGFNFGYHREGPPPQTFRTPLPQVSLEAPRHAPMSDYGYREANPSIVSNGNRMESSTLQDRQGPFNAFQYPVQMSYTQPYPQPSPQSHSYSLPSYPQLFPSNYMVFPSQTIQYRHPFGPSPSGYLAEASANSGQNSISPAQVDASHNLPLYKHGSNP